MNYDHVIQVAQTHAVTDLVQQGAVFGWRPRREAANRGLNSRRVLGWVINNTTAGRQPRRCEDFLEDLINTTATAAQFGAKRRRTPLETDTHFPSWLDKIRLI